MKSTLRFSAFLGRFISLSFLMLVSALLYAGALSASAPASFCPDDSGDAWVVVVDPGHGGEDGGTSSSGGVLEKDLNLAIGSKAADFCRLFGLTVAETRTTDTQIYDLYHDLEDYTGHKKLYDLRNRVKVARESSADLFLSIHMNQNPVASCRGTQVYYGTSAGSQPVGTLFQQYARTYLQPDNSRQEKAAGDRIFLLRQLEMPSVLVECGFLSNADDTAMLTDQAYQTKLSLVLSAAAAEALVMQNLA